MLHLTTFCGFCLLLKTEIVPKIFPNLNVVAHLVIPAGWGSCPLRLAIFFTFTCQENKLNHTSLRVWQA